MPQLHSQSDTLEDIIDRYASPAASSSPTVHHHDVYNSMPCHGESDGIARSLPSSLTPCLSKITHQRHASTNSGYFTRAELFGRPSPTPPSPMLSLCGLERIDARHRTGRGMPDIEPISSLFPGASLYAEPGSPIHSLAQSEHRVRAAAFSSPDVRSSHVLDLPSIESLRKSYFNLPQDEWVEAGTPTKQMVGSGFGPGPTLVHKTSFRFPNTGNSAKYQGYGKSKTNGTVRNVSPAEEALRQTLSTTVASRPPPPKSRGSSWASKLFSRQQLISTPQSAMKQRFSDDNISELEFVEPSTARESPQAILARVRDREDTLRSSVHFQADYSPKELQDDFTTTQNAHNATSPGGLPEIPSNGGRELKLPNSSLRTHSSSSSDDQASSSEPQDTAQALPQERKIMNSTKQKLSSSTTTVTFDQPPVSVQPNVALSVPSAALNVEPTLSPQPKLSMSSIKELIVQEPVPSQIPEDLTFANANAIIYGCVTMVAVRFILMNIGNSVRAIDLASEMGFAVVVGIIICALLYAVGGGRLRQVITYLGQVLDQQAWDVTWRLVHPEADIGQK